MSQLQTVPLVSIICPLYNKIDFIAETIQSVIDQSYTHWQFIIVDDGSTDGSYEFVKSLNHSNIVLLQNDSGIKGPSAARNIGIEKATGEYTIFLDADDILLPHCLEQRVREMMQDNKDFIVFQMNSFGTPVKEKTTFYSEDYLSDFIANNWKWTITGPIWRTSSLKSLGGFDIRFRILEDPELHTRALCAGFSFTVLYNSEADCLYRQFENKKINLSLTVESYYLFLYKLLAEENVLEKIGKQYQSAFLLSRKRAYNNVLVHFTPTNRDIDTLKKSLSQIDALYFDKKLISKTKVWFSWALLHAFFIWKKIPILRNKVWLFKKLNTKLL